MTILTDNGLSEAISMSMSREGLIGHLRDDNFAGPMIHLRSWPELQVLLHRAADLLQEAAANEIVRDALNAARSQGRSEPLARSAGSERCPSCGLVNGEHAEDCATHPLSPEESESFEAAAARASPGRTE